MEPYRFEPIGVIRSCYTQKFGTPRQPGLIADAEAQLEIFKPYRRNDAFRGLDAFSHIWILFVFHRCIQASWKATVRPPRLGGNRRVGVFASRSGFRPNPIGQSVVALSSVELHRDLIRLHLRGIDVIDGTPVLDIKPYVTYSDSIPQADCSYAQKAPATQKRVSFRASAIRDCGELEGHAYPRLRRLISDVLSMDPRPGYKSGDDAHHYGLRLWDLNIRFSIHADTIVVESISRIPED